MWLRWFWGEDGGVMKIFWVTWPQPHFRTISHLVCYLRNLIFFGGILKHFETIFRELIFNFVKMIKKIQLTSHLLSRRLTEIHGLPHAYTHTVLEMKLPSIPPMILLFWFPDSELFLLQLNKHSIIHSSITIFSTRLDSPSCLRNDDFCHLSNWFLHIFLSYIQQRVPNSLQHCKINRRSENLIFSF